MRLSLPPLLVLLLVVSCARVPARFTQAQPRDALYSGLVGRWRGGLAGAPAIVAPAGELVVVPAPDHDGLELRYREVAGAGSVERSLGHWHFGRSLDAAEWGGVNDDTLQAYRVVERSGGQNGAPMSLVLEAESADAGQSAPFRQRIRQRIEVATGALSLRTEVQAPGGNFRLQRAYVFRRAD